MNTNDKREKVALIIGASRGLGYALVEEYLKRGWHVIATERKAGSLSELAKKAPGKLKVEMIDITDQSQITSLRKHLAGRSFDLLFINAGVADGAAKKIGDVSTEEFMKVMLTNTLSPMRLDAHLKLQSAVIDLVL
jgi:NADP-dependent 3-hydroxy acid dehydrogenase YdfG